MLNLPFTYHIAPQLQQTGQVKSTPLAAPFSGPAEPCDLLWNTGMASQDLNQQLAEFQQATENGGLAGALRYLNARTAYRYTAIYRLDGQMMRNIHIYDRQGASTADLSEVPLGDSFCQFVIAENGFSTANSATDDRLLGHAYRGILNAYFGLPLSRKAGSIYGTFCHFDFKAIQLPDSEIPLIEAVSSLLMDQLESEVSGSDVSIRA